MTPVELNGSATSTSSLKARPVPAPAAHPLMLSEKGAELIGNFEGFRGSAYNDAAKPPNATIGYGHVLHPGPCTETDDRLEWTRAHALEVLHTDAGKAVLAIKQRVHVHLTQQQFDALVSFTYNVGIGWLYNSSLLTALNAGRYSAVPGLLAEWVHAGNVVLQGLVTRRRIEGELFAHGIY
jgi:lysozyme